MADSLLHRPYVPGGVGGPIQQIAESTRPYNYSGNDGNILLIFSLVLGSMLEPVDALAKDQNVDTGAFFPRYAPGWSQVLDLNRVPTELLNWLGQFTGHPEYKRLVGETDAQFRTRVIGLLQARLSWERGTMPAMKRALQETLTGAKQVYAIERAGSPWRMTFASLSSETPDVNRSIKALRSQKPAGIVLTYVTITGGTWLDVLGTHADWDEVELDFINWNQVLTDPTHT